MEWTKELDYSMRRDIAAAETIAKEQGIPPKRVVLDYGVATKAVAEIERLAASEASCVRAALDEVGNLKAERDTARAELHACGLELQTCRATLEEERRDGDAQRAEIERLTAELDHRAKKLDEWQASSDRFRLEAQRLTAELAGQSKAATDWREAAERHMARAEAVPHHTISETGGIELNWTFTIHTDGSPTSADGSIEALFAKWGPLLAPYLNGEQLADLRGDVVRAVDASRQGLTEEQALATAGPLSRDIYNRIGLATGNKIGAPEWMRDIIAAALLRASRGALAPGDISVSRAILERLAKAAESDSDAREARWAAERILQQAPLAAEPARTDPEAARRLAEARAERDQLDTKFRSYDGGDRPQSPPVSLIRDLRAAEERVRELEAAK